MSISKPYKVDMRRYTRGDDHDQDAEFATREEAIHYILREGWYFHRIWLNDVEVDFNGDVKHKDRHERLASVDRCNQMIVDDMFTAWRQGKKTLVKKVLSNCTSSSVTKVWRGKLEAMMQPQELVEFTELMEGQ